MIFFFILIMVCCVYSLESPQWGDSNEDTQHTFMEKIQRNIFILPGLALWLTIISSNYPWLEHTFMVSKVFEPLKFDCITKLNVDNCFRYSRGWVLCKICRDFYSPCTTITQSWGDRRLYITARCMYELLATLIILILAHDSFMILIFQAFLEL